MQLSIRLTVVISVGILCSIYDYTIATPVMQKTNYSVQYYNGSLLSPKTNRSVAPECMSDTHCHEHGICRDGKCKCDKGWLTWRNGPRCLYEQRSQTIALIVSILLGTLGIDWFILARDNGYYILAGMMKLLVCSGCCTIGVPLIRSAEGQALCYSCVVIISLGGIIWWIVDWARILAGGFHDGNDAPLVSW